MLKGQMWENISSNFATGIQLPLVYDVFAYVGSHYLVCQAWIDLKVLNQSGVTAVPTEWEQLD